MTCMTRSTKHLLSLRKPNPSPGPSPSRLNQVFAETFRDAKTKKAETGWLVATTCTLLTANRPSAVGQLYRFVTRPTPLGDDSKQAPLDVSKAVNSAAIMRESALKSVIFVGVPRVILSLAALHESLDEDVRKALRSYSRRTIHSDDVHLVFDRGRMLWNDIYKPFAEKLQDKLASYHPDFISFIIQCYGSVLSPLPGKVKGFNDTSGLDDPDQGNLSRVMGSIAGVASLRAEGGVGPQLTSHTFGLLKAREVENQSTEDKWLASDEGTEWVIQTVDKILDCVAVGDDSDEPSKARL